MQFAARFWDLSHYNLAFMKNHQNTFIARATSSWLEFPAPLLLVLGILLTIAAGTQAQQPSIDDALEPAEKSHDSLIGESVGKTALRLIAIDTPDQPLGPRLYWRELPRSTAAITCPTHFKIDGAEIIAPIADPNLLPREHDYTYPTLGSVRLKPGNHVITPGGITFEVTAGKTTSTHPALLISDKEIRIRCAPVRFDAIAPDGSPRRVKINVTWNDVPLLRESTYFNPLVIYLPVGADYRSTLGHFSLTPDGQFKAKMDSLKPNVEATAQGLRLKVTDENELATEPAPNDTHAPLHLLAHRGRTVFAEHEHAIFHVLLNGRSAALSAGEAKIFAQLENAKAPVLLGPIALPAVAKTTVDSVGFELDFATLPTGEHQLWIELGNQKSTPRTITIVPWRARSSFFVHSMSGCTGLWPTTDEGLEVLRTAGIEMGAGTGHTSVLNDQMPSFKSPTDNLPELSLQRAPNDVLLERLLRHQIRLIDLTPLRGPGLYLETLSYHHSYAPSVDRMIRHMSIFTQQTSEYPSFWGVNYSWYPMLQGYAEGGIPTDAHVTERNRALAETIQKSGLQPLTADERDWYLKKRNSAAPDDRAKALSLKEKAVAYFRAQGEHGWAKHNKLYNDAVRHARPGTVCTLFENAGHNTNKQIDQMFADMSASCYESYTDFGDWPMSAGWVTDLTHAHSAARPVWLTTCWGTSSEGQQKSLLHAFMRGLDGGGVPMQAEEPLDELARRGKGLRFLSQYGAIAKFAVPDRRIAILVTDAKSIFGTNLPFDYHAIYTHLTRLGVCPAMLTERDLISQGPAPGTNAILIVQEVDPLGGAALKALKNFQNNGGKIALLGENATAIEGAIVIPQKIENIWDLSGFQPQIHADFWRQFHQTWRPPLNKLLTEINVAPLATTDPKNAYTLTSDAGPVRYVAVIAEVDGQHSNTFDPLPDLKIELQGKEWIVRDLVKQTDLPGVVANNTLTVSAQLVTEPTTLLALYRSPPAAITLKITDQLTAAKTLDWTCTVTAKSGADMGAVPVRFTLVDPAGAERGLWFRGAGELVSFHIPDLSPAGNWKLTAQEQLTGVTVDHLLPIAAADKPAPVSQLPAVHVVNESHVRSVLKKPGEKLILVEASQTSLMPLAESLAKRLTETGIAARVWKVGPEDFAPIPVRWFPRAIDMENLRLIDAGKLIGHRQDLRPYIDTAARVHVPELGGYAEIEPRYLIPHDVILFSGGEIANSLRHVSAWTGSPHVPGRGQGRLLAVLNPFSAGNDALSIIANDKDGLAASADKLIKIATTPPANPLPKPARSLVAVTPAPRIAEVAKPYVNFTPLRRIDRLLAAQDGRTAVVLRGKPGALAMLSADGKVTSVLAANSWTTHRDPLNITFDDNGQCWDLAQTSRGIAMRAINAKGITQQFSAWPAEKGDPTAAGFAVAPNGKTVMVARPGALLIGSIDPSRWIRLDDVAHAKFRFEPLYPRLPLHAEFSPDSSAALVSWDSRAPLNSMGGPLAVPTATETMLIDASTATPLWRLSANEPSSGQFAVHPGFVAISKNAEKTALFDYLGTARILDRSGKILLEESLTAPRSPSAAPQGPPGGVGVGISLDGSLAAFGTTQNLAIARQEKIQRLPMPGLASLSVAPDGSQILLGLEHGEVLSISPEGTRRWALKVGDGAPIVKVIAGGKSVVGSNDGNVIWLSENGKEIARVNLNEAAQSARPVSESPDFRSLGAVPDYVMPETLTYAKAKLSAVQIDAWKTGEKGTQAFGMTFHPITAPIVFGESESAPDRLLHLVYRRPADNKALTITLRQGREVEVFDLDLPTPEFRVIDLPVRGKASVEIRSDGPAEIAECSLWSMQWPGPNLALVTPADVNMGVKSSTNDDVDPLGGDAPASGKMKEIKVWWPNSDPDRVKGQFLAPRFNPLWLVDGKRFGNGTIPPMAEKSAHAAIFGGFLTIDLSAEIGLVATYDRVNRQSQVARAICVFTGFDPSKGQLTGQPLASRADNDQFWRLLPLPAKTSLKQLGVHVFVDAASPCGLSEVEAYRGGSR